jgi:hypothetical protein
MAGGNNHAKQIVLDEAECMAKKLTNGSAGCQITQGRAIALLVKMIRPLYENEFVTEEDCKKRCKTGKFSTLKIGSVSMQAPIMFFVYMFPYVGLVFVLGKAEGWW